VTPGAFLTVGLPGPRLEPSTRKLLARLRPGGVILFARNLAADVEEGPARLAELTAALRRELPEVLLWIDAEGGPVDRLRGLVGPAPAGETLARRPPRQALRAGRWIGHALRLFGLDADFAPVVDLDRGIPGNALDHRTTGADPRRVAARGRAFLLGLHGSGVGGCLKHFPGLGAATADTHLHQAPIGLGTPELAPDLAPFVALGGLAGAVMVGHAAYPAYDPEARPATLSPPVLQGLLRGRLGFAGLAVSDDLEMQALAAWGEVPECAEASFAAGADVLLICKDLEVAVAAGERLARPSLAARREESAARLAAYRRHLERLRAAAPRRRFSLTAVRRGLAALV
jgi:beta-N-acetylhexosaminidase